MFNPETLADTELEIPVLEDTVQLGVKLNCRGETKSALEHRMGMATKAFFSCRAIHNKHFSRNERLDHYSEVVPATLLYGCEGWTAIQTTLTAVHQFEGGMLRRICRIRKAPTMSWSRYFATAARTARKIYLRKGKMLAEEQWLDRIFSFTKIISGASKTTDPRPYTHPRKWLQAVLQVSPPCRVPPCPRQEHARTTGKS